MLSFAFLAVLSATVAPGASSPDGGPQGATPSTEAIPTEGPVNPSNTGPTSPSAPSTAGVFIQNRFNPDLSLIADFALVGANVADQTAQSLALPGFLGETERAGKARGFNFNYLEFALSASVDPYFDFVGIIAFTPDEVSVEETYVTTRQLPFGFQLRLGKFLSAFGRQNGIHQHAWDFYDMPLVYEAFIGLEGFKNPGVRLSWTAPLDFLLELNLEVFQGRSDEPRLFDARGFQLTAQDGTVLSADQPFVPAMLVGSLKTSYDVGNHVFLAGASVMYGHALQTSIAGQPTDLAYSAPDTILYGGELTYKYLISSYRSLTWQSEYLGVVSSGDLALAADGVFHAAKKRQGGFYSQLVWRFDENGHWRLGGRFDLLAQNTFEVDAERQPLDNMLTRTTSMLEYSPTEFSRFRLQYAYDRSRFLEGERKDIHEVMLEMNIAVGPHGSHAF